MTTLRWCPLRPLPGLLAIGVKAPIPAPSDEGGAYRDTLAALLGGVEIPGTAIRAALATGSVVLLGVQEIIVGGNALVDGEKDVKESAARLLRSLLVLAKERPATYVLQQVAEIAASQRGAPAAGLELGRPSRLKDLLSPLEARLEGCGVRERMDAPRFAALLVHLDDLYDDASVQLQRLHALAGRGIEEARSLAPDFIHRLYSEFARASLSDHLLAERPGRSEAESGRSTGLLALLPELMEALE